ncbi:uncharacterized protein STEHIDRAFT_122663 [Stereum hirsutum FP-91666 SS1]|uniref:uncharacterized protein n=1 Tax=Stereum hirsutum (strain FP-91666) TaxID=721885 RepID=UPI0004449B29|nr:uncharacterized protein STEHIDRAFT_122663 [Stereum hirsutum FP-91666 SS1]EIM84641.1 hypothetical protein STEHIDRAFT_122663 [Stereum hirsutum FP-91666 SS1]
MASPSFDIDLPINTKKKANSDYGSLVSSNSNSNSPSILWSTTTSEGSGVFSDFASFMLLAIADAVESLGDTAKSAAESLREVEGEVRDEERDVHRQNRTTLAESSGFLPTHRSCRLPLSSISE